MIATLRQRNRQLAIKLAISLVIATLLGSVLALLLRKTQSQRALLEQHTRIVTNLPRMQAETASIQQQANAFRQTLPAGFGSRSAGLLLYTRLDEIKSRLQPSEMAVTPLESKEGLQTVGFTLKVPLARYAELVNGMGQLQTNLVPHVDFRELSIAPKTAEGIITVSGSVVLPPLTGGTP